MGLSAPIFPYFLLERRWSPALVLYLIYSELVALVLETNWYVNEILLSFSVERVEVPLEVSGDDASSASVAAPRIPQMAFFNENNQKVASEVRMQ